MPVFVGNGSAENNTFYLHFPRDVMGEWLKVGPEII